MKADSTSSTAYSAAKQSRIASIELFRIAAIIAVVIMHSQPFGFASPPNPKHSLSTLIDLACRFSVPFFFIVSGYFFTERIQAGKPVMATFWRSAQRLLSVYAVWCLFYVLVPFKFLGELPTQGWLTLVLRQLSELPKYGLNLPFRGPQEILWFLPALVIGLGIVALSMANGWQKYLPYGALALYGIGLLWGSYSLIWTGNDAMDFAFNTRNGPFFSTLCVTVGSLISTQRSQGKWCFGVKEAGAIAFGGLLLQIVEATGLSATAGVPFRSFDYVIGTVVFGAGIFLLALARPNWGQGWSLLPWSRYTLGIFLIHLVLLDAIEPLDLRYNNALWEVASPLAIYLVSLILMVVFARWRALRRFVC
ncbi:MAG: acyltransferase [Phormidesmis sp.]